MRGLRHRSTATEGILLLAGIRSRLAYANVMASVPRRNGAVVIISIAVTALAGSGLALAFGTFAQKIDYELDATPTRVTIDNLDGNRRKDLAIIDSSTPSSVSIRLGNADGSFVAEDDAIIPGAGSAGGIVGGDFDNDGLRDLAVTVPQDDEVAILRGRGDGTFELAKRTAGGSQPRAIATADFNRDGNLDLVVATSFSPDVAVDEVALLRGKGNLKFRAPVGYEVGDEPQGIVIGKLDEDRHRDLAVVNGTPDVSVLRGKADGKFRAAVPYPAEDDGQGEAGNAIDAGDLDRDGDLDLAVAIGDHHVALLEGGGDATFAEPVHLTVGAYPRFLTIAQLTDDRKLDIAATNQDDDNLSVLVNQGSLNFEGAIDYPTLDRPWAIEASDFDRDGGNDLAVVNEGGDMVSVFLNQP